MNLEIYGFMVRYIYFPFWCLVVFISNPSLGSFNLMIYAGGSAASILEIALIDVANILRHNLSRRKAFREEIA